MALICLPSCHSVGPSSYEIIFDVPHGAGNSVQGVRSVGRWSLG